MDLSKVRKGIDKLDFELINLLSERTKLIKTIAKDKQKNNVKIVQKNRIEEMLKKRRSLAEKLDLNPDFIEHLFAGIINESISVQKKLRGKT